MSSPRLFSNRNNILDDSSSKTAINSHVARSPTALESNAEINESTPLIAPQAAAHNPAAASSRRIPIFVTVGGIVFTVWLLIDELDFLTAESQDNIKTERYITVALSCLSSLLFYVQPTITGLHETIYSLHHRQLPPGLHTLNKKRERTALGGLITLSIPVALLSGGTTYYFAFTALGKTFPHIPGFLQHCLSIILGIGTTIGTFASEGMSSYKSFRDILAKEQIKTYCSPTSKYISRTVGYGVGALDAIGDSVITTASWIEILKIKKMGGKYAILAASLIPASIDFLFVGRNMRDMTNGMIKHIGTHNRSRLVCDTLSIAPLTLVAGYLAYQYFSAMQDLTRQMAEDFNIHDTDIKEGFAIVVAMAVALSTFIISQYSLYHGIKDIVSLCWHNAPSLDNTPVENTNNANTDTSIVKSPRASVNSNSNCDRTSNDDDVSPYTSARNRPSSPLFIPHRKSDGTINDDNNAIALSNTPTSYKTPASFNQF